MALQPRGHMVVTNDATAYRFELNIAPNGEFSFRVMYREVFIFGLFNLIRENVTFTTYDRIVHCLLYMMCHSYEFVGGKIIVFSSVTHLSNLCVFLCFIFSEISNNYFSVQVFRAGILQLESQHGLYGFAQPPTPTPTRSRRRAREEENSVSTPTSSRNTRAAAATNRDRNGRFIPSSPVATSTTTNDAVTAECAICYQQRQSSEQRRCAQCHEMLCCTCSQEIIVRTATEYFDCPYCRGHFVNDVIDLFGEE
jgi:hypothetical protein